MNRILDERGLAGPILIGVVAWALGAVLLLTNTLVSAQQIDERVQVITSEVSPIDQNLDSVALAAEVNEKAAAIKAAAEPLPKQAGEVADLSNTIEASATSIGKVAGPINDSVHGIEDKVTSINKTVPEINATVKSINTTVKDIGATVTALNGTVKGINADVLSIDGHVASIGGSAKGIFSSLDTTLGVVKSIRGEHKVASGFGDGIAGINRRADTVINLANGSKRDTGNVLAHVKSIDTSAKNIDTKT